MITDNAEKLLNHLNNTTYDISAQALSSCLNIPFSEVKRALKELMDNGLLYCVISDSDNILKIKSTNKGLSYFPIQKKIKTISRKKFWYSVIGSFIAGLASGFLINYLCNVIK